MNLQIAMMAFSICHFLLNRTGCPPTYILVTAFYDAQVRLFKSLFDGLTRYKGIRFMTVDSAQGEESPIQIIDMTTLGGAIPESVGFLGGRSNQVQFLAALA